MSRQTLIAVTGSSIPYIFDLPLILSLPAGFEFRFRYSPKWVSKSVRDLVADDRGRRQLAGGDLIIVFHSRETGRLIPLRKCEVIDLERLGPTYFLRFAVGEFVPVSKEVIDNDNWRSARLRENDRLSTCGSDLLDADGFDLRNDLPEGKYLCLTNKEPKLWNPQKPEEICNTDHERWAALAALIMSEPKLHTVPLFSLAGITDRKGNWQRVTAMENSFSPGGKSGGGFSLIQGERYRLRLIEWRDDPRRKKNDSQGEHDPYDEHNTIYRVGCSVDNATLHLEGKSDLVIGKYDVLEFSLKAVGAGYSEMQLRVDMLSQSPKSNNLFETRTWPEIYSIRVPLRVRVRWRTRARTVCLFCLGLLLFVAPALVPSIWPGSASWITGMQGTVVELTGLMFLFAAYGDFLSRYGQFAETIRGLLPPQPGGTT